MNPTAITIDQARAVPGLLEAVRIAGITKRVLDSDVPVMVEPNRHGGYTVMAEDGRGDVMCGNTAADHDGQPKLPASTNDEDRIASALLMRFMVRWCNSGYVGQIPEWAR